MSSPEVQWTLTQLGSVVGSLTTPLKRIDRDNSEFFEGSIQDRTAGLKKANYVGATLADRAPTPAGTEYDHKLETTVGVRIEGLDHSKHGYVDPSGSEGVPFDGDGGLVDRIRDALLVERQYPDAGGSNVTYHSLTISNESSQSNNWSDYYLYSFDVIFDGYETLP